LVIEEPTGLGRVVQEAGDERTAAFEASMLTNILPILSRRRSADIRHNMAQERQGILLRASCGQGYRQ
jgi:hypothetical protein